MVEIGIFTALAPICEAQLSFAAHQKYILWFFSLWWMIKGIMPLFSLLFVFLWIRKPWLDNFMSIITLECSKLWIWMRIYFRDILLIRISRGANNCVQRAFEKKRFQFLLSNERIHFLWIVFKKKIKRINNAEEFLHSSLIIFTKGANIFGQDCTYLLSLEC